MFYRAKGLMLLASLAVAMGAVATHLGAQEDASPVPVDTAALPDLGPDQERWLTRNPYRADPATYAKAQQVGQEAFAKNCARCHGPDAVSAGIFPDLRYLDPLEAGDTWFISRYHHGLKRDGKVLMPPLGETLGQKTGWAIRSWLDARHMK